MDRIKKFQNEIFAYYAVAGRVLPWRKTFNPYRILVSEIMLQQTQVSRVTIKYAEFLKAFPTVQKLARAKSSEVLSVWQGLGYNRRGLYLKRSADIIVERFNGRIPNDLNLLVTLPGVGSNTAGAICAYAFNMPVVFIETNIRRVFLGYFFAGKQDISDAELLPIIRRALPNEHIREWYWALMDYGSEYSKIHISQENPNRNSKQYTKQSKFVGSKRQLRGKILAYILEQKERFVRTEELFDLVHKKSQELILEIIDKLIVEGFLRYVPNTQNKLVTIAK